MTPAPQPLVLLVDDDADSRELYAIGLQPLGFEIADVDSADAALLFVQDAPREPDVVITDLTMPGLPAVELIQKLRSDPRTQAIRTIVLTGLTRGQRLDAIRTAGCDLVVTKPCLAEELAEHIHAVLGPR
jgi:CheY-like chemotaxis protein